MLLKRCGRLLGKLASPSQLQAIDNGAEKQYRLIVLDKVSGISFLVDTGAAISVIPRDSAGNIRIELSIFKLYVANNTTIDTFGKKLLHLDFRLRRHQSWIFTVAAVSRAILAADFLAHYGFLVDLRRKRLVNSETQFFFMEIVAYESYS